MNLDRLIRAIQEELGVNAHGNAGLDTWIAIYNRICPNKSTSSALIEKRTIGENVIATLEPEVQSCAPA